jgi:RNA polymerase sigma-70 factor (ECF subfamily)
MPATEPSAEIDLARRCAAGDRAAQSALFQQQRVAVHGTLFRVLGSNRDMEDLIQDTFIAVFASISSFRGESSLRTWIDTIAVRVSYRHLSRRAPRGQHLHAVADLSAQSINPEREAGVREAVRRLYAVLDRIEPKHRIAYTLHVVDGRPIKEVARVTRASVLAVKNRVWRARRRVHELALREPVLSEFLSHTRRPHEAE